MKYLGLIILLFACKSPQPEYYSVEKDTIFVTEKVEIVKKPDTVAFPIHITRIIKDTIKEFSFDTIFKYRESPTRINFKFSDTARSGSFTIAGVGSDTISEYQKRPVITETRKYFIPKKKETSFSDNVKSWFWLFIAFIALILLLSVVKK